ncbi:MAG: CpaF family protein [Candidatus Tectomicrobia bacterium]|nr:CpaF family protein [Candidatus Tectomicrobia bacterium]
MGLAERLQKANGESPSPAAVLPQGLRREDGALFELKSRVHRLLIQRLDFSRLSSVDRGELEGGFRLEIAKLLRDLKPGMSRGEEERLTGEVLNEIFGLGPIEPLLHDPTVEEIMVNGSRRVFCARFGKIFLTDTIFKDDAHLLQIIERIVSSMGRRIDESSPMVDARLSDGSRVNAIIPPLALNGPCLTIRRFPAERLTVDRLIAFGSLTPHMAGLLKACVQARLNLLVSGGTGAGKTTLLNVLSGFIPADERILTIEDAAELQLQQSHVVRLETRPPNVEDKGAVTTRDLVRNALRMRPDRIVVGEVRGEEALDMLQAMNTGHDGSISTIHANSPRDALSRLEVMIAMAGVDVPLRALRQQVASALDVVVQITRLRDGSRKITAISEVTGMEGDMVTMQDIFVFREEGRMPDGRVRGRHQPTGIRPHFFHRFQELGVEVDEHNLFWQGA